MTNPYVKHSAHLCPSCGAEYIMSRDIGSWGEHDPFLHACPRCGLSSLEAIEFIDKRRKALIEASQIYNKACKDLKLIEEDAPKERKRSYEIADIIYDRTLKKCIIDLEMARQTYNEACDANAIIEIGKNRRLENE